MTAANPTGAKLSAYRLLTDDGRVITLGDATRLGSPRDKGIHDGIAIAGVPGRSWYLTAVLNRVMFIYFIGEKGVLPGGKQYLLDNLNQFPEGRDRFYREFFLPLCFFGFDNL